MEDSAELIWADGPASLPNEPEKRRIRSWGRWFEHLANLAYTSSLVYSTRAELYANLVPGANTPAMVIGDPTSGYDGLYMKVGATATGSWSRLGDVPGYSFIKATNAGEGTENAIVATSSIPIPASDGAAFIVLNIVATNTASPVTVAFNGGSALPIKTSSGNDVATGGLLAGMVVAGYKVANTFRLLTDQASAAIVASAEAAQVAAEAAAADALAAASSVSAALALFTDVGATYSTIAAFQASTITTEQRVRVLGFYNAFDAGEEILLERALPAGINLLLYSNEFNRSVWAISASSLTLTADAIRTEGGTRSATKFVCTTFNGAHQHLYSYSFANSTEYTFSAKFKAAEYSGARLSLPSSAFGANAFVTLNLLTGVATKGSAIASDGYGVVDLGDGLYRVWVRATTTAAASGNLTVQVGSNSSTFSFAGDGTSGIYVQDVQLDTVNTLTEYVDTKEMAWSRRVTGGRWTSANGITFRLSPSQMLTTRKFGAKVNGFEANSKYYGTDDTAAIAGGIGYAALVGSKLWISPGNHYLAKQNYTVTSVDDYSGYIFAGFPNVNVDGFGREVSVILLDEDETHYTNAATDRIAYLFDTGANLTPFNKRKFKRSAWDRFSVRGRWSHHPGRRGVAVWRIEGVADVHIEGVGTSDIRSVGLKGRHNDAYEILNNRSERHGAGVWRGQECSNVRASGNYIRWADDDCLDFHSSTAIGSTQPVRSNLILTNNIVIDGEQIIGLGFRFGVVANNISERCKGGGIYLGLEQPQEGVGSASGIICTGNLVKDPLARYDPTNPTVWIGASSAAGIVIAGSGRSTAGTTNAVAPGRYNTVANEFLPPYSDQGTIPAWGAMNAANAAVNASPGAFANICSNNTVIRTLPAVAAFSDWGTGSSYFDGETGWVDPPMGDDQFKSYAYQMSGDLYGVDFSGNKSFGIKVAGLQFIVPASSSLDRKTAFDRIMVRGFEVVDAKNGIIKDNLGPLVSVADMDCWGIHILDCIFDLDPLHRAANRKTGPRDGSWTLDGTNDWRAIVLANLSGYVIGRNTFRNCYDPMKANSDIYLQGDVFDNVVQCDPAAIGFSTSNKGVATVHRAGKGFRYQIYECDPEQTSTYGRLKNSCPTQASAVPSSGKFVTGHFVENTAAWSVSSGKILKGWTKDGVGTTTGVVYPTASHEWYPIYDVVA